MRKRISSYAISIGVTADKYMLLHGYCGSIDIIEKNAWEKLKKDSFSRNINDDELSEYLTTRGYITRMTHEEEVAYVTRLASALHKKDLFLYASYTLLVTYDCNFRCPYCFEHNTITDKLRKETMTRDVVDKVFGIIDKAQENKILKAKHVTLFGGEPLLSKNHDIVSYIVGKGLERNLKFSAITNGYDLIYYRDLLSPDKIYHLQITLDGIEEMHNKKRPHCLGHSTFQTIISNIGMALEKDVAITVRFNADKNNVMQLQSLKELFDELGFTKYKKFGFESARLLNYDSNISSKERLQLLTPTELIKMQDEMNFICGYQDFGIYSNIYNAICNKKPLKYKATFCGSQIGACIFDPLYKIYPCWDVVGKKEYVIGDFSSGEIKWNEKRKNEWILSDINAYPDCSMCKFALLCGGGCASCRPNNHCTQMFNIIKYATKRAYTNFNKQIKNYE